MVSQPAILETTAAIVGGVVSNDGYSITAVGGAVSTDGYSIATAIGGSVFHP